MKRFLALSLYCALPSPALEPIRVSESVYYIRGVSRFAHLPAFEAANRRNAYNTYIRMQGGDK